jgi:hypothetical protein
VLTISDDPGSRKEVAALVWLSIGGVKEAMAISATTGLRQRDLDLSDAIRCQS